MYTYKKRDVIQWNLLHFELKIYVFFSAKYSQGRRRRITRVPDRDILIPSITNKCHWLCYFYIKSETTPAVKRYASTRSSFCCVFFLFGEQIKEKHFPRWQSTHCFRHKWFASGKNNNQNIPKSHKCELNKQSSFRLFIE